MDGFLSAESVWPQ